MTPAVVLDRLMLGTARQPLPLEGALAAGLDAGDPALPLKLLALAAQAQRFERPVWD